eukprot:7386543-Prymnesium_polylepis.3
MDRSGGGCTRHTRTSLAARWRLGRKTPTEHARTHYQHPAAAGERTGCGLSQLDMGGPVP